MVQWGNSNIGLNRKSLHNIIFVHATAASVILSTSLQRLIQFEVITNYNISSPFFVKGVPIIRIIYTTHF